MNCEYTRVTAVQLREHLIFFAEVHIQCSKIEPFLIQYLSNSFNNAMLLFVFQINFPCELMDSIVLPIISLKGLYFKELPLLRCVN